VPRPSANGASTGQRRSRTSATHGDHEGRPGHGGQLGVLIANGLNIVFVSRQLGQANPTVTLSTYAHLFERADRAEAAREALEADYEASAGRRRILS
jgi:hypothetical protein